MNGAVAAIQAIFPAVVTAVVALVTLLAMDRLLLRRKKDATGENNLPGQLLLLAATGVAIVLVILALPVADSTRNQLLGLLGLALTALIGLASTTFVANAMAGIMLRSVNNFRPGDFLRAGEHFGRVTERGLFHTEVQTEDSDLTTLPNLLLVSTPVTVVRSEGTIVSATVSLGYDKSHTELEPILLEAALAAQLEKPFVQVVELSDHAVTYRVAGFLPEVKWLLTARSNLRKSILDSLHTAQVEIVSPTFMNQRRLPVDEPVLPQSAQPTSATKGGGSPAGPEDIVFEKAEAAERVEELRKTRDELGRQIHESEQRLKDADTAEKPRIEKQLAALKTELATLEARLAHLESTPSP